MDDQPTVVVLFSERTDRCSNLEFRIIRRNSYCQGLCERRTDIVNVQRRSTLAINENDIAIIMKSEVTVLDGRS